MATKPKRTPENTLPEAIRLHSNYSFYDEDGIHQQWAAGVITDPEHIALLIARKVEHQAIEE